MWARTLPSGRGRQVNSGPGNGDLSRANPRRRQSHMCVRKNSLVKIPERRWEAISGWDSIVRGGEVWMEAVRMGWEWGKAQIHKPFRN